MVAEGRFGGRNGPFCAQKSTKIDKDFEVYLLMANELLPFLPFQSV
jgi:hypothetical protein